MPRAIFTCPNTLWRAEEPCVRDERIARLGRQNEQRPFTEFAKALTHTSFQQLGSLLRPRADDRNCSRRIDGTTMVLPVRKRLKNSGGISNFWMRTPSFHRHSVRAFLTARGWAAKLMDASRHTPRSMRKPPSCCGAWGLPRGVYAAFTPIAPMAHRPLMPARDRQDDPETTERPMLDILYIALAAGFFVAAAASVRLLERL